ncbi:MAG: hypothetical protein K5866_08895 [Treponema sp.]|nr:hypothetical protein [Treponema sp.]
MKKILAYVLTGMALFMTASCSGILANDKAELEELDVQAKLSETSSKAENLSIFTLVSSDSYTSFSSSLSTNSEYDETSDDKVEFYLKFSQEVDSSTVSAITVSPVLDTKTAETDDEYFSVGSPLSCEYEVEDDLVTLSLSLKGQPYVELYIDATKLKAVNGQLLNADYDSCQGESRDDDYSFYFESSDKSGYTYGSKRSSGLRQTGLTLYSYSTYYDYFKNKDSTYTNSFYIKKSIYITEDLSDLLKAHIAIQKLDFSSRKWVDLATSLSKEADTYNNYYIFTFEEASPGDHLRVVVKDVQNFKTSSYIQNGYPLRYTYNNGIQFDIPSSFADYIVEDNNVYASDTEILNKVTNVEVENSQLLSFSVKIKNTNGSYQGDYTGKVCGVSSDLIDKLLFLDGEYNTLDVGKEGDSYIVTASNPVTYGYNRDKTYYSTYTYTFIKPIKTDFVRIYYKPDFTIYFHQQSLTGDIDDLASYKIGYASDIDERLNTKTNGYVAYDTINLVSFNKKNIAQSTSLNDITSFILYPNERFTITMSTSSSTSSDKIWLGLYKNTSLAYSYTVGNNIRSDTIGNYSDTPVLYVVKSKISSGEQPLLNLEIAAIN